jgi:hypothetical protein
MLYTNYLDVLKQMCKYIGVLNLGRRQQRAFKHMNNTALRSELSRIRELKRNAEATI